MIWVTADMHFNHKLIAELRGFQSTKEMDEILLENWNKAVKPGDEIYHLGDFIFGKADVIKKYRAKLNGKLHIVLGGHDYKNGIHKLGNLFSSVSDLKTIKYFHKRIILCHYSMRVWPGSHHNTYHLFGHSHGGLDGLNTGKSFDIGVDCWDYKPVHIDEIMEKFETLPDNFNLIKKEVQNDS